MCLIAMQLYRVAFLFKSAENLARLPDPKAIVPCQSLVSPDAEGDLSENQPTFCFDMPSLLV